MSNVKTFRLRITFCKQGRLALLSHLEVARAMERVVRRAGLPFAVSQGFSPHMKIAFGAALPVGVGGTHELVDLQLTRYIPAEEVLDVLRDASVPDLMVKQCQYIDSGASAASAAYPISTYRALFSCAPAHIPVPAEIKVVRKKKEKTLVVEDFLVGDMKLAGATLTFSLESKPSGSLRSDVLLNACCTQANLSEGTDSDSQEAPLLFLLENNEVSLIDPLPCSEENPLRILSITRIDQRAV